MPTVRIHLNWPAIGIGGDYPTSNGSSRQTNPAPGPAVPQGDHERSIHPSTNKDDYTWLGSFAEEGKPKSIAQVKYKENNPPAFVENLHLYLLEENEGDPKQTWLEPRWVTPWGCSDLEGSVDTGPKGALCPLSWAEPTSPVTTIRYRDTGGDDPEYDMTVTACLSHEKYATHAACVSAHNANEEIRACAPATGSVCPP